MLPTPTRFREGDWLQTMITSDSALDFPRDSGQITKC